MRLWTKVWIAVVAVCIVVSVYEAPNAVHLWRFIRLIQKSRQTGSGKLDIPAIVTDKLVAADHEAGDMLRYCLQCYNENSNMEDLAALVAKWPDNEFLLSELAEQLATSRVVDTRATLTLVDRLLELNGDNAHYQYMKGWIFLTDPNRPDSLEKALKQFESGHNLPEFYLPYSKYQHRLGQLYKKATMMWERATFDSFYMKLAKYIFRSSGLPDRLTGDHLRDLMISVGGIADRVIENTDDIETLLACAILLGPPEEFRLRKLDMSETEAWESRFRLARSVALLRAIRKRPFFDIVPTINTVLIVVLAAFLFSSVIYSMLAEPVETLCSWLPPRRRRKPKVCENIKPWFLSDIGLAGIVVLLILWEFTKQKPEEDYPAWTILFSVIFIPWSMVQFHLIHPVNLARLRSPGLWLGLLCSSLWFKGAVFWTWGSLSISDSGLVQYGLVLLEWSALCVLIWSEATYQSELFIEKHRRYVSLIVDWVVILMALSIFGPLYVQMERSFDDRLSQYGPLPEATEETYNYVILGHGLSEELSEDEKLEGIPRYFEYAASNDIEKVITERRTAGRPISDNRLRGMLQNCGRDARPIILSALDDPNAFDVLVIRAEWGDRSVKEQLERIYRERLAVYSEAGPESPMQGPSSLGELLRLAGTLASVGDGAEGQDRVSHLMEQVVEKTQSLGTGPSLSDPRHADRIMQPFWESLNKLPEANATNLLKHYLRQTQFVDLFTDRRRDIAQLTALLAGGDRELAEEVVVVLAGLPSVTESADAPFAESEEQRTMRLTRYRDRNSSRCLDAVFAHLGTGSMRLLLEHLDSGNEQLRAFVVWRVTSLGYNWSDEQLAAMQKDSYWKVRLNALFACDPDQLTTALEDQSAVVRVVAQMLIQAQSR
ncbi:MAG: hypothetical protein ABIF19_20280 [Planctomycetota bacterium]